MTFVLHYINWHYTVAIIDLIRIVRNFIWFFYNFFSISILLKTLFSPFNKLGEGYKKSLKPTKWAETFLINTLMRIVGALLRSVLILLGIIFVILTAVLGTVFFFVWLLAPIFVLVLIVIGIKLISVG